MTTIELLLDQALVAWSIVAAVYGVYILMDYQPQSDKQAQPESAPVTDGENNNQQKVNESEAAQLEEAMPVSIQQTEQEQLPQKAKEQPQPSQKVRLRKKPSGFQS